MTISMICPTQGNPIALKRTIDSLKGICDEFIVGDVMVFEEDRKIVAAYSNDVNLKLVRLPFNYIYKNGFSETLNVLAEHATNNIVLYLNVGEVIGNGRDNILSTINDKYNCYYLDHATERHRWFRMYNRKEMQWSGLIHEEIVGEHRPYHKPIFTFADTDKDMVNPFKAKVYNDIKEIIYWHQLMRIVDEPEVLAATSIGWVQFAKDSYQSMKDRLEKKGVRPAAFENGDFKAYMMDIYSSEEFEKERFDTNNIIEFQGDKKYLL